MKIFCPEHKRGFFAPRQNPIACENRGHILGELDFEGRARMLTENWWQYCCNCEHFYPTGLGQDGTASCLACARQISARYMCDRCHTVGFESNTPVKTKNFSLTSEGMPRPSCPGCLQAPAGDVREHDCDGLGVSFTTGLTSCPICQERLDISPSFPASVANYLKRTRKKFSVTFDYHSELFEPAEDGEFVLVRNGTEPGHELMLPRTPRFSSARDFYDYFQDYYYCADPAVGEVQVVQPAIVDRVENGWKFKTPGILEVVSDPVTRKIRTNKSTEEKALASEVTPAILCPNCNSLVETKYAFCWHCGKSTGTKKRSAARSSEETKSLVYPVPGGDEITLSREVNAIPSGPSIFAWASEEQAAQASSGRSAIKLIAVIGLVLVALVSFVIVRRSASTVPNDIAGNQVTEASAPSEPAAQPSGPTAQPSEPATSDTHHADLELKKLQEKRIIDNGSDRAKLLESLAAAEKQYPNDYRVPYERAKLSINAQEIHSHHEAFGALRLAAQKALENGKADEMLSSLVTDRAGDFHKLSHGHGEWAQLEKALKNKDKSTLSAKVHH